MKLILINLSDNLQNILGAGSCFVKTDVPYGLYSIKAYLDSKGVKTDVYDAFLEKASLDTCYETIKNSTAEIVGISVLTCSGKMAFQLGKKIKTELPNKLVIMGNIHADYFANFYLKNKCADFIVHREGEETIFELISALKNNVCASLIKGISFLNKKGVVITTPKRSYINNLSSIPLANKSLNIPSYIGPITKNSEIKLCTSRGCINRCKFCCVHSGNSYRFHSAEGIFEEIKYLKDTYGINKFRFEEPLFTGNRKRILDLCNIIKKNKLSIIWGCVGHIQCIDKEMLSSMKSAGCVKIVYGIESGNEKILKSIGKIFTLKDVERIINLTTEFGLEVHGLFVIGFPKETEKEILETIDFAKKLKINIAQFAIFTPFPGSYFYDMLVKEKKIDIDLNNVEKTINDWERYTQYPAFGNELNPIYHPDTVDYKRLIELQRKALRGFYFRPRTLFTKQSLIKIRSYKNLCEHLSAVRKLF